MVDLPAPGAPTPPAAPAMPTDHGAPPAPGAPNPADPSHPPADGSSATRPRRLERLAAVLPDWTGSIRFRLTALYSLLLFALAAVMVLGIYLVLAGRLAHERVYVTYRFNRVEQVPGGVEITPGSVRAQYKSVEALTNERALALLRTYSLSALGFLFLASLGVGWIVAGRVLAPIDRITSVARDIQATDLSRRIALRGPPDELKELADTFDAMLARLDEAFEGQRRFIQEASHELRNPLAVIRTNLDVALADPDPDPAEVRATAELVRRTASRMSRLVDDLLAYARRGAPAHEISRFDAADVVAEAVEEFVAPAAARHLRLEVVAVPGLLVDGDRHALREALANLVVNAVRLAPEGSRIRLGAGREGEWIWLAVEDEGPGIPAEHRDLVFQRFWRGDSAAAREQGRSGLGLAIVDQIARDHRGGVVLTESTAGGSIFTIWVPAAGHDPAPSPA
ncbi:MAG: Two-component sensor histidine kinase [Acidimicrobiales bacterium]|nr:Two-component sensor histidine kinase [Acidimicrobiales bacterium]